MTGFDARLYQVIEAQPYPRLFVTVSGAHLYGFPSPDSDYDLRGIHILSLSEVVGLFEPLETIEDSQVVHGLEIDLVTHDVRKFFDLLLKRNGYVLEQLYSPLVVQPSPEHDELKRIARGCITRQHAHHYLGFAKTQWRLFEKEQPRRVKPLLYVFRVLLTGIHLMQTGEIEANLVHLNAHFKLAYVDDLIALKLAGAEQSALAAGDISFYQAEYARLTGELEKAMEQSTLLDAPSSKPALNDLLLRLRLRPDSA